MHTTKALIAVAAITCATMAHAGALDFDNSDWDQTTNVFEGAKSAYYLVSTNPALARAQVQRCYSQVPKDAYSNVAEKCLALDMAVYATEVGQIANGSMPPDLYFSKANIVQRRDQTLSLFGAPKEQTDVYYAKVVETVQSGILAAMTGQ